MHEKLKNKRWISKVSISFQTIVNLYWRKSVRVTASIFVNFCSKYLDRKFHRFSGGDEDGAFIENVQSVRLFNFLHLEFPSATEHFSSLAQFCADAFVVVPNEILLVFRLCNPKCFTSFSLSNTLHSSWNPCAMHLIAWKWFSAPLRFRDHFSNGGLAFP